MRRFNARMFAPAEQRTMLRRPQRQQFRDLRQRKRLRLGDLQDGRYDLRRKKSQPKGLTNHFGNAVDWSFVTRHGYPMNHSPLWISNFTEPSSRILNRSDWQDSSFETLARLMISKTLSGFSRSALRIFSRSLIIFCSVFCMLACHDPHEGKSED